MNAKELKTLATELGINVAAYDLRKKEDKLALLSAIESNQIAPPDCEFEGQPVYKTDTQNEIDYSNDCVKGICPATELPVLEEDEIPFCNTPDSNDVEDFRELLDNSLLNEQESLSIFDLAGIVKQTVKRIANLSRDWCLREARGFMSLFGSYTKLTMRTPRRVARRANRFIADICKASNGLLHAQYTRGV
jgi:hypothetical protein